MGGDMSEAHWWLSFGDSRSRGAVIVKAATFSDAVQQATALGINPGLNVVALKLSEERSAVLVESDCNRLLIPAEAESILARPVGNRAAQPRIHRIRYGEFELDLKLQDDADHDADPGGLDFMDAMGMDVPPGLGD